VDEVRPLQDGSDVEALAEGAPKAPSLDIEGGPVGRFHIRILADGTVVFGDLPTGLAEVAAVVAGSDAVGQPIAEHSDES